NGLESSNGRGRGRFSHHSYLIRRPHRPTTVSGPVLTLRPTADTHGLSAFIRARFCPGSIGRRVVTRPRGEMRSLLPGDLCATTDKPSSICFLSQSPFESNLI